MKRFVLFFIGLPMILAVPWAWPSAAAQTPLPGPTPSYLSGAAALHPTVSFSLKNDVSPPLRSLKPASAPAGIAETVIPLRRLPQRRGSTQSGAAPLQDLTVQSWAGALAMPSANTNFEGVSNIDGYVPPDTNGDVSLDYYVQWVNASFAVFDKATGAMVAGFPKPGNTLWSGFGGGCENNNDGDPVVKYDRLANRWVMTQFSVSTKPYLQCVAVSTTSDPTGPYYRYAFSYGNTDFPDYGKLGIWPDGYYIAYNIFEWGTTFAGSKVCAFDRSAMLVGAAATQQCFQLSSNYGGLLPSDLDGTTLPPAGSPNYFVALDQDAQGVWDMLDVWKFHVDWAHPHDTSFNGPAQVSVSSFNLACGDGETPCIPQPGTSQRLDSLGDRLMYRLAYRNRAGTESLVVNHAVTAGSSVGIRWYELRNPAGKTMANGTPVLYQQGTYAPDSSFRWMGSIAMDQDGDMALGYSVSSGNLYPSIRYAGRLTGDPLGILPQGESTLMNGGGYQQSYSRWGDYSSISVDPSDDCTFWYTQEYYDSTSDANWQTRIGSFKYPFCGLPKGTLQGKVYDAGSSTLITGAQVTAVGAGSSSGTITDSSGNYSIFLPTGIYTLTASAAGYLTDFVPSVGVTSSMTTTQALGLAAHPTSTPAPTGTPTPTPISVMSGATGTPDPSITPTAYKLCFPLVTNDWAP